MALYQETEQQTAQRIMASKISIIKCLNAGDYETAKGMREQLNAEAKWFREHDLPQFADLCVNETIW